MKALGIFVTLVLVLAMVVGLAYAWLPGVRGVVNTQMHAVQKMDDTTSYETRKAVEDTARAMIASYNADVLTYQQYKDSVSSEKQSWAEQARMRANKTASSYNTYVLQNDYVWKDNVPYDIRNELTYVKE